MVRLHTSYSLTPPTRVPTMSSILITGAARGIGHELTSRAALRGDLVFAIVRNQTDAIRRQHRDQHHPMRHRNLESRVCSPAPDALSRRSASTQRGENRQQHADDGRRP
jgi:NAD(P)-dependent dehydrogenase (short-subunit alcohol dehydrogenase family)